MNLNLLYYRHNKSGVACKISPMLIPFYDLTIVLKGSLNYKINNKKYTVNSNSCIFIPKKGKRERFEGSSFCDYVSFNFDVDTDFNLPVFMEGCVDNGVRYSVLACDEFNNLLNSKKNECITGALNSIINSLISFNGRKHYSPVTVLIINFLQNNYKERLSLNGICRSVAYSPIYCESVFKKDTGFSVIDYLLNLRVDKAKQLLIENVLPIKEIARQTGFNDENYFSRQFKKKAGISPLQYKKLN